MVSARSLHATETGINCELMGDLAVMRTYSYKTFLLAEHCSGRYGSNPQEMAGFESFVLLNNVKVKKIATWIFEKLNSVVIIY